LQRLTSEENARIHAAVLAAQARSESDFAVTVIPASDRYLLFPLLWAAVIALITGGVMAVGWPALGLRIGIAAEAGVFVVASLVLDWLPLRLMLVPRHHKHMQARALAHRAFAAKILADDDPRPGVLFFVSIAERYVEVITERKVRERIDDSVWQGIIADFVTAVKGGRIADGVLTAVNAGAAVLERHFPKR
jgi:putative membrane protein